MFGCWRRATASASMWKRASWSGAGMAAGQDHLEGDEPIEPALPSLVDDAHAAPAQLAEDFVTRDQGPTSGRASFGCFRE